MDDTLTYSAFESRFRDKKYIGSGGFAKVYKVFDFAKNHYVALKVADVRPEWKQFTLQREVELVNNLPEHRNIGRYDACYRFNTGIAGEIDFAILRFYEYGNLEQFLNKQKINDEDKKLIILGILSGLSFLHKNNIIHRDLKSQNILLHREDGVWTPKIIDFGLSRQMQGNSVTNNSSIGLSFAFAAPEQILNKKITRNVDLWAVGVIIYRIMTGELPFKVDDDEGDSSAKYQLEISKKVLAGEIPPEVNLVQEPFKSVILRCLVVDSTQRAQTAEELIDFINGFTEQGTLSSTTQSLEIDQEFQETGFEGAHTIEIPQLTRFLSSEEMEPKGSSTSSSDLPERQSSFRASLQELNADSESDSRPEVNVLGKSSPKFSRRTLLILFGLLFILMLAALSYFFNFGRSAELDLASKTGVKSGTAVAREVRIKASFDDFTRRIMESQDKSSLEDLRLIIDSAYAYKEIPPLKYYLSNQWSKNASLKQLAVKYPDEWKVLMERLKLQLN